MKHAELRSIVHNVADSLASGIGLLIGVYEMDIFGEASRSPGKVLTVDFLRGSVVGGQASPSLAEAISLYSAALAELCSKTGWSVTEIREAKVSYWSDELGRRFAVTIEDRSGRRSITEYAGNPAQRVKIIDKQGRLRPKPSVRSWS